MSTEEGPFVPEDVGTGRLCLSWQARRPATASATDVTNDVSSAQGFFGRRKCQDEHFVPDSRNY